MRDGSRRRGALLPGLPVLAILLSVVALGTRCGGRDVDRGSRRVVAIERLLAPGNAPAVPPRDGIAAVLLIDVSGSMNESIDRQSGPKLDVARRAALDLVRQFDRYASAHPDEPVILGLAEFSGAGPSSVHEVLPLSKPDPARAQRALDALRAGGGTPIGEAMVFGYRALNETGLSRRHLLVVTDGENTEGYGPSEVMAALNRRPESERPSVYFVAFDIAASRFDAVRNAGGLVLAAASAAELTETLDVLLTGKILVEGQ